MLRLLHVQGELGNVEFPATAAARGKGEPALAVRDAAHPEIAGDARHLDIAGDAGRRRGGHILHEEPSGLRLGDAALEFRDQIRRDLVAIGLDDVPQPRERLTRRPTDHAIELAGRWMEGADVAAPENVRPAHDAKARFLKGHVEEADAWEK
jgi:hypothetical protein